jgi:outer membrane protein OmpA-like peptidoglycan-associated protein
VSIYAVFHISTEGVAKRWGIRQRQAVATFLVAASLLSACATGDPDRNAKSGAAIGAIAGAVVGHQLDDKHGKIVGAAVGAFAGAMVGVYMDEQQRSFEKELAEEREKQELAIQRYEDDTLKLNLNNEVSFAFDSAAIKPSFESTLEKLARILVKYNQTVVHVVGHADDTGTAEYNQHLSERRAENVAYFLEDQGVPAARIRVEGRGRSEPRASHETEGDRQLNRRVEIYVRPIKKGQEEQAYESPRY